MLSESDVRFYHDNGYIVVPAVYSAEEVAKLRRVTEAFVEKSRQVTENDDTYDLEDTHTAEHPMVRRLKTPDLIHETYREASRKPEVVAILQQLIGPDVRYQTGKLNLKSAGGGAAVEWHQDWAFYPHTNDDLCAVGILMDDVDLENGPLMVAPGSHNGPTYDHHSNGYFCGAVNDAAADPEYERAVPLTGKAGSISIHHVRILHGSRPNLSGRDRRLLLFQYCAADAWPLLAAPDIEAFDANLLSGEPSVVPRLADVPVRMPLPPAKHGGSIYENQRGSRASILGHPEEKVVVAAE
ncbi:MAG: phytanoyl-CoA dioxygenase family protein [Alphaproteobacteria bacterium]|jgi:ectoine hydroxylase-related dioxygenase (phytanoyl-CoA dioxygenase family)|nr:phytanoyl-CoA dioxygenase family protein [Alphaproteobacteria bacterium]